MLLSFHKETLDGDFLFHSGADLRIKSISKSFVSLKNRYKIKVPVSGISMYGCETFT